MRQVKVGNRLDLWLRTLAATALAGMTIVAAIPAQATPYYGVRAAAGPHNWVGGSGQTSASDSYNQTTGTLPTNNLVNYSAMAAASLRSGTINLFSMVNRQCGASICGPVSTGADIQMWDKITLTNSGAATRISLNTIVTGSFLGGGGARYRVRFASTPGGFDPNAGWTRIWEGEPTAITEDWLLVLGGSNSFYIEVEAITSTLLGSLPSPSSAMASLLPSTTPNPSLTATSPDYGLHLSLNLPRGITMTSDSGVFLADAQAPTPSVPEPAMLGLFGIGLAGISLRNRRCKAA